MHIVVLTTAHPTDDVRVKSKVVDSFLDAGHEVTWIGPEKSFFTTDRDLRVHWQLTGKTAGRAGRLMSVPRTFAAAWRREQSAHNVDWIYAPDPDAALLALAVARKWGARTIFDVHEAFHGAHVRAWVGPRLGGLASGSVKAVLSRIAAATDLVIGVNLSVLAPLIDPKHALIVRNAPPRWFAEGSHEPRADGTVVVCHGKAQASNGTTAVLEALTLLPADADVRVLMFPGTGASDGDTYMPDFREQVAHRQVGDRLRLQDAVTYDAMPNLLDQCDVGMIACGRTLGVVGLPNRIFEYMARGLPVLVPSYAPEMVAVVEREGIGRCVDLEDPHEVAAALKWFTEHRAETVEMGRRARDAFVQRYSWEAEFQPVLEAVRRRGGSS